MIRLTKMCISVLLFLTAMVTGNRKPEGKNYEIDESGTITFKTGIKIEGKIEKPQVVIFMTKEDPIYDDFKLDYSFLEEIKKPIKIDPITK